MAVDVEPPSRAPRDASMPVSRAFTRLVVMTLVCIALAAAIGYAFIDTNLGQALDDRALRGRVVQHAAARADSNRLLQTITNSSLALLGGALMVVALIRGRWHLALAVGVVILGANVTTQLLKHGLDRPDLGEVMYRATVNTWPSGHTTVAASLAAALVLVVPARARPLAATVGAAYSGAIAVGVMAAGWHRPSDAAGAFAVVGAWTFGVTALLVVWRGTGHPAHRASMPGLALGAIVVLGVAFVAMIVTTTINRAEGIELVRLGAAYLVAALALAVIAVAFVCSIVLSLRGISLDSHPDARRLPA